MAKVTYPYAVIMNGEIIPANTLIEVKTVSDEETTDKKKATVEQPKEEVTPNVTSDEKAVKKNDKRTGRKS